MDRISSWAYWKNLLWILTANVLGRNKFTYWLFNAKYSPTKSELSRLRKDCNSPVDRIKLYYYLLLSHLRIKNTITREMVELLGFRWVCRDMNANKYRCEQHPSFDKHLTLWIDEKDSYGLKSFFICLTDNDESFEIAELGNFTSSRFHHLYFLLTHIFEYTHRDIPNIARLPN